MLSAMQTHDLQFYTESTNAAKNTESYVISILSHLSNEVKREMKEVRRDETSLDKDIEKEANSLNELKRTFAKALDQAKTKVYATQQMRARSGTQNIVEENTPSPPLDPWLSNNGKSCFLRALMSKRFNIVYHCKRVT